MNGPGGAGDRPPPWRDRRFVAIAGAFALLIVAAGLPITFWLMNLGGTQMLIVNVDDRPSAMIEDGDWRALVLNTRDREEAQALTSRLSRPMSPRPRVVIAPADDDIVPALLAVIEQLRPAQVIIAGVPGAGSGWTMVEQMSRRLGVDLRFSDGMMELDGATLRIAVIGTQASGQAAAVVVRRGETSIVLALTAGRVSAPGQVLVTDKPRLGGDAALAIVTGSDGPPERLEVVVGRRDIVRVAMESTTVRIYGGTRREPER